MLDLLCFVSFFFLLLYAIVFILDSKIFSLSLHFRILTIMCLGLTFLLFIFWVHWDFLDVISNLRRLGPYFLKFIFCPILSVLSWDSNYTYVRILEIDPWVLRLWALSVIFSSVFWLNNCDYYIIKFQLFLIVYTLLLNVASDFSPVTILYNSRICTELFCVVSISLLILNICSFLWHIFAFMSLNIFIIATLKPCLLIIILSRLTVSIDWFCFSWCGSYFLFYLVIFC